MRYLVFAFLAAAAAYGSEAEYLGGSIKSIPKNMTGDLDLTDPANLTFVYYKGVFRLPFENIKSFEIAPAKSRIPLRHRSGVLNLSFRTDDHANEVISFKLTGKDVATTEWTLKSHIQEPGTANTATSRTRLPESWWGDRYWRTTRNMTDSEVTGTK